MTSRRAALAAAEYSVRERMALSRDNLLARRAATLNRAVTKPSLPTRVREIVSTAPNVTLVAAFIVGSLVLGPMKVVSLVVRNGLAAWIAKTVRKMMGR